MKKHFLKFLILPLICLATACSGLDQDDFSANNNNDPSQISPADPSDNGNSNEPEIAEETPSQGDKYVEFSLINWKSIFFPNSDPNDPEFKMVLEGRLIFTGGNQNEACCGGRIVRVVDFTNERYVDVRAEQGGDEGHLNIEIRTTSDAVLRMYLTSYDYDTGQEDVLQDCSHTGCVALEWLKLASVLDQ